MGVARPFYISNDFSLLVQAGNDFSKMALLKMLQVPNIFAPKY